MRGVHKHLIFAVSALGAVAMAAPAYAACGVNPAASPASLEGTGGALTPASLDLDLNLNANIVGMWSVQFLVGSNVVDFGYAQWHSDGTEIMNSGGRPPYSQNFCLGVWAKTGPSRYKLNHWALSYDSSGTLNGRVNIREDVTVDPRSDTYSGPFTIDVYDPNSGSALQHVAGRVVGKRVTVNSGL